MIVDDDHPELERWASFALNWRLRAASSPASSTSALSTSSGRCRRGSVPINQRPKNPYCQVPLASHRVVCAAQLFWQWNPGRVSVGAQEACQCGIAASCAA